MNSEQLKVIAEAYENIVEAHGRLQGLASNVANKAEYDFLTAMADHLVITYDEAFEDREIAPNPARSDLVDDLSAARMDIHQITELDRAYEDLLGARLELEKLNLDDPDEADFIKYIRGSLDDDARSAVLIVTAELGANNFDRPEMAIYDYQLESLNEQLTNFSKLIRDADKRAQATLTEDDEYGDDEVRQATDTPQGNAAVMARLLVDEDDENDPVTYEDEDDEGDYEPDLNYVETDYDRAEDLASDPDYLAMRAEGYSHLEAVESVNAERRGEPPPSLQDTPTEFTATVGQDHSDSAVAYFKSEHRLSEPEALLQAQKIANLSGEEFKITSVKTDEIDEWDVEDDQTPVHAKGTNYTMDFEFNGAAGQISCTRALTFDVDHDEIDDQLGDLKVSMRSGDNERVVDFLARNDVDIRNAIKTAAATADGIHEDRIVSVDRGDREGVYRVTVTNGKEHMDIDVRVDMDPDSVGDVLNAKVSGGAGLIAPSDSNAKSTHFNWYYEKDDLGIERLVHHNDTRDAEAMSAISLSSADLKSAIGPLFEADHAKAMELREQMAADHKFAHPNYGGSENPDYEFFDVFRTAGQDEGVYSMDVPLPKSARELFEDEPESHVPDDPNRNYYRLEITIGEDGHPDLFRRGAEGEGLDEYLFDVYNTGIRSGAQKFAQERGIIADTSTDADDENDPVPYHDDRPAMTADWGEIPDRPVSDDGRLLREVDGQMVASVVVPENLLKAFDADTLDELGVHFDDQNRVKLPVKTVGGEVRLDPHFTPDSYQDRFEVDLFDHHRDALQQEADRMSAEASAEKTKTENSITVAAHSDFEGNTAQQRHLDVRVDDQDFTVVATFDENGRVSAIDVDPDQIGFDPALDGGSRYRELTSLLDTVRDPIAERVQEYNDNVDEHILVDTGWTESRTFAAGYCVIPEAEIDRVADNAEASGSYLTAGDFRTAEGYPVRLEFDASVNIESATIPGTKTSLKPVLENSRDHFVEAKAQLADHGIVLSRAESGDYRVDYHSTSTSYREGEHGSAQFADTVSGATEIGQKMASERDQQVTTRFQNDYERFERQAA